MSFGQIIDILLICGAVQGIFVGTFLFSSKENRKSCPSLIVMIFLFSLNIITLQLRMHGDQLRLPPELFPHINTVFFFLYGPLLLQYCRNMLEKQSGESSLKLIHFLPSIIYTAAIFLLMLLSPEFLTTRLSHDLLAVPAILHLAVYYSIVLAAVAKTWKKKAGTFGKNRHISILLAILIAILLCFLVGVVIEFILKAIENSYNPWQIVWLLISVGIYSIAYLHMKRPAAGRNLPSAKYSKSSLTDQDAEQYRKKLVELLEQQKPFLNPDLSLPALAQKLSIQTHHLSQVINNYFHQNFFDFINSYRITEAVKKLTDKENAHYSISTIGFDVGFNSLSAFNRAFKKHTGKSPSQYRK